MAFIAMLHSAFSYLFIKIGVGVNPVIINQKFRNYENQTARGQNFGQTPY